MANWQSEDFGVSKSWQIARTQAHLHVDGNYAGISVSLTKCRPSDELIASMGLPALPKKGG